MLAMKNIHNIDSLKQTISEMLLMSRFVDDFEVEVDNMTFVIDVKLNHLYRAHKDMGGVSFDKAIRQAIPDYYEIILNVK